MNDLKDKIINANNTMLDSLEAELSNNAITVKEAKAKIRAVEKQLINSFTVVDLEQSIKDEMFARVDKLKEPYKLSSRVFTVKGSTVRNAIIGGVALAGVATAVGVALTSCSKQEEPTPIVQEQNNDKEMSAEQVDPAMSEEVVAFIDTTIIATDNALTSGINLSLNEQFTDADKETYARILTDYRIVANMDNISPKQFAELFGEKDELTNDLIESYFQYNTMIKKHLLTVKSNNMLDYSNLYNNAKDAEVLNESERLIVLVNEATTDEERLQAAKNWYAYTINILTSTEGEIALSPQALDTLITHTEAFDELTRGCYAGIIGAHVDDELEHHLNAGAEQCIGHVINNQLNVEDPIIYTLKSEFRLHFIEKLSSKFQNIANTKMLLIATKETLNTYNSYDNVITCVAADVDLQKYVKAEDYVEYQVQIMEQENIEDKSQNDSGVSDGQGGIISKEDMEDHNAETKEEYEEAVREETEKENDETYITDQDGNMIEGTAEDVQQGYLDAWNAGLNGQEKPAYTNNESYNAGLDAGWEAVQKHLASLQATSIQDQINELVAFRDYVAQFAVEEVENSKQL